MRIEDVPSDAIAHWAATCTEIVYAACNGNRDDYAASPSLGPEQARRFEAFVRRLAAHAFLAREGGATAAQPNLRYIGGSWTRRDAAGDEPPLVMDSSPSKPPPACNPYEAAKTQAHDVAQALATELCQRITFCDWASVVPNFAPNFSVGKMADEAILEGTVRYTGGDYGRPLCHREDAGRALLMVCTAEQGDDTPPAPVTAAERPLRAPTAARPLFDVLLVPGHFTSFREFAEIARDEVEALAAGNKRAVLTDLGNEPPSALRARCESARLASLGFVPDPSMVKEGLREAVRERVRQAVHK